MNAQAEKDGYLCKVLRHPPAVLAVPTDTEGSEKVLSLACALAASYAGGGRTETVEKTYYRILSGQIVGKELEEAAEAFQL